MGHQDQIGGAFYKLRGKQTIVVFRADPYTDAADRGIYNVRVVITSEEVGFSFSRRSLSHPPGLLSLRSCQDESVIKVLAVSLEETCADPNVQSAGRSFQPLHGLAIARFGGIPSVGS